MELVINNNLFNVKCVFLPKDVQNGMMGKKFDDSFDGMLFLMDDEAHSFWMKNCITNLDIIFIGNGIINKIYHNCPPCKTPECQHYEGFGDLVLELLGNTCKTYNIKDGDSVLI